MSTSTSTKSSADRVSDTTAATSRVTVETETCSPRCVLPIIVILSLSCVLYYVIGTMTAPPWYPSDHDHVRCTVANGIIGNYFKVLHGVAASSKYNGWVTHPEVMKLDVECTGYSEECKVMEHEMLSLVNKYISVFPGISSMTGDIPGICEHSKIRSERIAGGKYFTDSALSGLLNVYPIGILFPVIPGFILISLLFGAKSGGGAVAGVDAVKSD